MKRPKRSLSRQADALFSRFIKERDRRCVAEGEATACGGEYQCAHLLSRRYRLIRWNPDNAVTLCRNHHLFYTHRPLEWSVWMEENYPGRYEVLRRRALAGTKPDPKAAVKVLTNLLAMMEEAS